jgi:hypothetical protein
MPGPGPTDPPARDARFQSAALSSFCVLFEHHRKIQQNRTQGTQLGAILHHRRNTMYNTFYKCIEV